MAGICFVLLVHLLTKVSHAENSVTILCLPKSYKWLNVDFLPKIENNLYDEGLDSMVLVLHEKSGSKKENALGGHHTFSGMGHQAFSLFEGEGKGSERKETEGKGKI